LTVVALLHPGAMGARVGGEIVAAGHEVRWLPAGRSEATAARAEAEGLTATASPAELVDGADLVLSLLPPQVAVDVAGLVAGTGFAGTYVDANPVSPGTLARVRQAVEARGATLVDAGVVGPPPRDGRRTHLYLAGDPDRVAAVEVVLTGSRVRPVVVGRTVGQASAAKQAYALYNKGRMVLAAAADALAEAHGVRHVLAAEGDRPGAELLAELDQLRDGLASVGWRWAPELDELALALEAAGLDPTAVRGLAADLGRGAR
jgi:3-hydroxyisobutyrate dehydrogenase-like beta-hydroxyacid dehydrogenase